MGRTNLLSKLITKRIRQRYESDEEQSKLEKRFTLAAIFCLLVPTAFSLFGIIYLLIKDALATPGGTTMVSMLGIALGGLLFLTIVLLVVPLQASKAKDRRKLKKRIKELTAGEDNDNLGEQRIALASAAFRAVPGIVRQTPGSTQQKVVVSPIVQQAITQAGFAPEDLLYQGAIIGEACAICKLALEKTDEIWRCPYCQKLFHKEHLLMWLKQHQNCPVCHGNLLLQVEGNQAPTSHGSTMTNTY